MASTRTLLSIAPNLKLPEEAVTETFAILGKRGSGKTTTARVLTEELLHVGLPALILDPTGVWWGLRASADGAGDGYPVIIFGGDHADVPLEETSGSLIADVVVTRRISAVPGSVRVVQERDPAILHRPVGTAVTDRGESDALP